MAHARQFVDSIDENPEVLLDLDNGDPLRVLAEGTSISPPNLRRTTAQGIRSDGELQLAAAYDGRELPLALKMKRTAAENQSTVIQKLAHILSQPEGAWLRCLDEDMHAPLFFRTRQASFDVIDEILSADPLRQLKIAPSADPFGYGLPEFGFGTITNDPTSGTNKMLLQLPPIKGDVPTPLRLGFPIADGIHKTRVASLIDYDNTVLTAPYYKSLQGGTINGSPPAGWTVVDATDTSMVGGNRRRMTKSSGTALCRPTDAVVQEWADLPAGNYRVMIRVGAAPAGSEVLFFNRPPSVGSDLIRDEAVAKAVITTAAGGKDWLDLDVVAMPGGAPPTDVVFGNAGATGPALWNVAVWSSVASMTIDLDAIVLIPAGRPNTIARNGMVQFPSAYGSRTVTWDGHAGYRIANGISAYALSTTSVVAASDVSGGDPLVAPGATNYLHYFADTADLSSSSRLSDDKTWTTLVSWLYYPRYLYNRPEAT